MDISSQDTTTQPISDDHELAKALAGVLPGVQSVPDQPPSDTNLPAEEESVTPTAPSTTPSATTPSAAPFVSPTLPGATASTPAAPVAGDLDDIKRDALGELRPLIDRVNLPAEEKFDIYLMLIRSTDDTSLVSPAHSAALDIADEKKRAEALLDIIKEIDYLSRKDAPTS